MEEFSLWLNMPEGYIPTGEFRAPKANETYLAIDSEGEWCAMTSARDHNPKVPQIILREIKRGKEKTKQAEKHVSEVSRTKGRKQSKRTLVGS